MKNYYCEYVRDENEANIVNFTWNLEIAADSSREAYELFLEKTDNLPFKIIVKEIYYNDYLAAEAFDGHIDSARTVEEIVAVNKLKDEQKLRKSAKNYEDELSGFSEGGYLLLSVEDKIKFQKVYESYAEIMQTRGLYSEEVDFVKLWVGFKDRELGQSMLAQAEAKKPAAERGKSQLAQTITMGIVAGNMVKSQQLRELKELNESVDEIAENVEDVSGGFEG
ncbi:MAG: DUF2200 family protein [Opitutae bacterium]|nr:DUF2200 family protein [Opitutae bacterium]